MIEHSDIDYLQDILQFIGEFDILGTWIAITGWMVVGQDDGHGIESQGLLDHFSGMDSGAVHGTAKHLHEFQYPVTAVQKQTGKHLALIAAEFILKRRLRVVRGFDGNTPSELISAEPFGFREDYSLGAGR